METTLCPTGLRFGDRGLRFGSHVFMNEGRVKDLGVHDRWKNPGPAKVHKILKDTV